MENRDLEFDMEKGKSSIIKVIGVGGGGNNALKHMYERGIHGVDFVICNTDQQTLDNNPVSNKVQLGISTTEGLGAGADPEVGEKAAIESIDEIKAALGQNTKMVFITAGMGGGTGTGAAPVVAKIAKEMGILTVAIVTVPFSFEGKRRLEQAESGLEKLRANVDSLIVINNDKLRQQFGNLGFKQGFSKADEVLTNAAKGMAEVITAPFAINIDFRDAKSVLQNSGTALMSTGIATGEKRAEEAVRKALDSPLLNDNKITGAKDVLLLILSGSEEENEATMDEIGIINDFVQEEAGGNNAANIIFGVGTDETLKDAIKVLVIATGFAKDEKKINLGDAGKKVVSLNENAPRKESPFRSREERVVQQEADKGLIVLDDEEDDFNTPIFQTSTIANNNTWQVEEETPRQFAVHRIEEEENYDNQPEFIPYEEEDTDAVSFTFDVEEDIDENPFGKFEAEDRPAPSFSIRQNEENIPPKVDHTRLEPRNYPKPNNDNGGGFYNQAKITEPQAVSSVAEVYTEEEKPVTFTFDEPIKVETQEGMLFITKEKEKVDPKVQERRNKFKEFSTRYQSTEAENDFENVPAFKRRNIQIETENASNEQHNFFISENERGEVQIRENRFLNRDVD